VESSGILVPFGRYVLKERLAQGGMGEVFRAVAVGEHGFEKPVVVKRILPAHAGRDDLTDLFVAEAKLMTRLVHPNIVEVLDFGRGEHRDYYLVLELVEGTDLGRLLRAHAARGEPFPVPLALFVASQVLRGLHHAHTRLTGTDAREGSVVVHRDVSPSNVLCSAEGEVKVADFGVALVTQKATAGGDRGDAGVAGKPGYMAPEQFDGLPVDPRADIFSVGVVLQQMLTAELPFRGETPEEQQDAARRGAREPARDRRPEVSEALEAILERALAPTPAARFPDAKAMAQAIEGLRDHGQPLANGDDLAEAVRAAQRELPAAGRRVIALSSSAPAGGGEAAPPSDDAPRELTRTGAPGGVGAFTLRFPTKQRDGVSEHAGGAADRWSAPEPRTERIAADDRPPPSAAAVLLSTGTEIDRLPEDTVVPPSEPPVGGPRQRAIRRGAVTALVAVMVLGLVAFVVRAPPGGDRREGSAAPSSLPVPPPAASEAPPAPAITLAAIATAVPAPRPSGRSLAAASSSRPRPLAEASATAAPPGPATAAPVDTTSCTGAVHFSSATSWDVSGGPAPAQTPNRVVWRCGDYTLMARSRVDSTVTRTVAVHVGPDHVAEVRLDAR
jgi:eukaryotic-like serine/threonine-protein kinase